MTIIWSTLGGLYADALVIIADFTEECVHRLLTWKEGMERQGLRVNVGRTKSYVVHVQAFPYYRAQASSHVPSAALV